MTVKRYMDYMAEQMRAVAEHKWYMSERVGHDVGLNEALVDFVSSGQAVKFAKDYAVKHNVTSLEFDVNNVLNGDSCLVFELRAIAHNHETGEEVILEEKRLNYCYGKKEDCPYKQKDEKGLNLCQRLPTNKVLTS